jgi:cysteine synthase B
MEAIVQKETSLMSALRQLEPQVGHTPLHEITRLNPRRQVRIFAKKEWEQLSGSVKARAAFEIVRKAIERGELDRSKVLLDATSGNTGIAYANIGKQLRIPVTLCLPENASPQRKDILKSLGARLIFTSRLEGTDGAQELARDLAASDPSKYYYADQYRNEYNWKAHYYGTAPEIWQALPQITHFVAGLGTTGTFVGTGRRLKLYQPAIRLIALQPDLPLHGLEGWKHLETALVPAIFDPSLANEQLTVSTEEAYDMLRDAWRLEGLLLSPSSAANLAGAVRIAEQVEQGVIVTVFPDNADKYADVTTKILGNDLL